MPTVELGDRSAVDSAPYDNVMMRTTGEYVNAKGNRESRDRVYPRFAENAESQWVLFCGRGLSHSRVSCTGRRVAGATVWGNRQEYF